MKQHLVALGSGVLFAVGLALSGMTDPSKVLAFLDLTGAWDPSLAFVMAGAVGTHALWLRIARGRAEAPPSAKRRVDLQLILGAALFGLGWGLSGYCPGPALAAAAYGRREALELLAGMVLGMTLFAAWKRSRAEAAAVTAASTSANH